MKRIDQLTKIAADIDSNLLATQETPQFESPHYQIAYGPTRCTFSMRGWPRVTVVHGGIIASFRPEREGQKFGQLTFEQLTDAACRAALNPLPHLEVTHQSDKKHLAELKRKVESTAHKIERDAEYLAALKEARG